MLLYTAVDCGSPPSITNGPPGMTSTTTLGGIVTYNCTSGYILSGTATVSCLASGSWSTRPTCTGMYIVRDKVVWLTMYHLFVTHE